MSDMRIGGGHAHMHHGVNALHSSRHSKEAGGAAASAAAAGSAHIHAAAPVASAHQSKVPQDHFVQGARESNTQHVPRHIRDLANGLAANYGSSAHHMG